MNSELKIQLDKIVDDLAKTDGVDGSLIVDGNGEVLSHHLLHDVDIELFGPMANVITGSSKRLTDFSNQGKIERILVESKKGKALFLHLKNVHFIVLMRNNANVGMIMFSSKRASQEIIDLTKDLTPIQLEEQTIEPAEEVIETVPGPAETQKPVNEEEAIETTELPEKIIESEKEIAEPTGRMTIETAEEATIKTEEDVTETVELQEVSEVESGTLTEEPETPVEEEKPDMSIPVIKPPITFPKLKKVTEIPEDETERVDLLLKIYESIFLAMSIGASKIMGVAPARGLTRKFLPIEECKILLDGVDINNNSTIDFVKIKENADKIPISKREEIFKESFGKIITIITENYGKVMGYSAFRAMIRPEFKIINESYGNLLNDLGVKEQLHPELRDFFN